MFHNPLFSSVQGIMVAVEFSKLKRKLKEKCEHYRKSYTAREMYDVRNIWSHDGKILFSNINERNKVKAFYD